MKEIELKVLNNSKPAFEEILLDYSKYYERFMEGFIKKTKTSYWNYFKLFFDYRKFNEFRQNYC